MLHHLITKNMISWIKTGLWNTYFSAEHTAKNPNPHDWFSLVSEMLPDPHLLWQIKDWALCI